MPILLLPLSAWLALFCGAAMAQAPVPAPSAVQALPAAPGKRVDQRIERLRIEDDGAVVEELRVGGQTENVTVSPKASVPSYEIQPPAGSRTRSQAGETLQASPGQRVWNVLKF